MQTSTKAPTTILDLPTELLEHVFAYLDWDRSIHLTPVRPDIANISLVCHQLRKAVIPLYFRHVKLRLRWYHDELVEPKLFKLRLDHPDLVKHVRCVQ